MTTTIDSNRYKNLTHEQKLQLFEINKRLVFHIAKRYKCHENMYCDMIQAGYEGLWKGICSLDKYDPLKAKLSTWLGWYIQNELGEFTYYQANNSGLSACATTVKRAMNNHERDDFESMSEAKRRLFRFAFSLDKPLERDDSDSMTFAEVFVGGEDEFYDGMSEAVQELLSGLKPKQREVIVKYYGIGCDSHTFRELGAEYGVSYQRIWQIRDEALEALRDMPGVEELAVYLK